MPDGRIGRRLAEARREAQLSQQALATALGVSIRTVQNYESGRFVPYRHLAALGRLLACSPTWLLEGEDDPGTARLVAASRKQRAELRLNLERLRSLTEQMRSSLRSRPS